MSGVDGETVLVLEKGAVTDAGLCGFAADRPPGPPASTGPGPEGAGTGTRHTNTEAKSPFIPNCLSSSLAVGCLWGQFTPTPSGVSVNRPRRHREPDPPMQGNSNFTA